VTTETSSNRDIELRDRVIERVAQIIVRRRLETPAVLFFESNRPLAFLAGQAMLLTLPLLGSFIPPADLEALSHILGSEESLDLLIQRIETLAAQRGSRKDAEAA